MSIVEINIFWCNSAEYCKNSKSKEIPLTYIGTQQAIQFNETFMNSNKIDFDGILTTIKLSDIMTALLCCRNTKYKEIIVSPFIKKTYIEDLDKLKIRIKFLKDWIKVNWINYILDKEVIDILTSILDLIKIIKNTNIIIYKEFEEEIPYLYENLDYLQKYINLFLLWFSLIFGEFYGEDKIV